MTAHTSSPAPLAPVSIKNDCLVGAKAIRRFLGEDNFSIDFIYDMANDPKTPITRIRGRLFVLKSDLMDYIRAKR